MNLQKPEFLDSLRQLLQTDPGPLTGTESLADLGWDSLAIVQFLAFADEQFGTALPPRAVRECATPDQLFQLVAAGESH